MKTWTICEWQLDHTNQCDKLVQLCGGFATRRDAENSLTYTRATREGRDVFARRAK